MSWTLMQLHQDSRNSDAGCSGAVFTPSPRTDRASASATIYFSLGLQLGSTYILSLAEPGIYSFAASSRTTNVLSIVHNGGWRIKTSAGRNSSFQLDFLSKRRCASCPKKNMARTNKVNSVLSIIQYSNFGYVHKAISMLEEFPTENTTFCVLVFAFHLCLLLKRLKKFSTLPCP